MVLSDISLKKYNTFGLDYKTDSLIIISSEDEAISLFSNRKVLKEPLFILGGGSNILFTKDFNGTIIHPEIKGIEIIEQINETIIISAGAGVPWDELVQWTVNNGYGGLENLSFIPGTVGATPVQNIGAYGVEVKDTIEKVVAISLADGTHREFTNEECRFGYRESIFKGELKGMYLITSVWYRLATNPSPNTVYGSLSEEVQRLGPVSLSTVRQAVINIRMSKLPDPDKIGNAGSFFKNPVITQSLSEELLRKYPQLPAFKDHTGLAKIAAGWLIDQCGWKGKCIGDAGVHDKQALVLVNHGKATGPEILKLSETISKSVFDKFGIRLQTEVEIL
jgi:UDP-N-acetylmuramate dehydrogenase